MKIRVTGFVLAMVLLLSVAMPAFASNESRNIPQASSDREQSAPSVLAVTGGRTDSPFVLDGAAMYGLTYEVYMNTNYITVDSFVTAVDRNAVVEEEKGTVVVTSEATEAVVTVMVNGGFVIAAGAVGTANVEEESLRLTARKGDYYVEANGRVLYVEDGVILVDGKVALPVRVLAKIFNMDVAYDAESKKVTLTHQKEGGAYLEDGETYYDEDMI